MPFFMKFLASIVLVFGVIGALVSPIMLFSSLLSAVIGFGLLYSVGEIISLLRKINDHCCMKVEGK